MRMNVSRALLGLALAAAVVAAPAVAGAEAANSFPDFSASAWWAPAMYSATSLGLIQGEAQPGHAPVLAPNQPVTRAEWATMLVRAGGYDATLVPAAPAGGSYGAQGVAAARQAQPFADVPASAWYAPDVDALVKAGVILPSAYPGGALHPNQPITRAEAAGWAGRVLQQRGANLAALGRVHAITVMDAATQAALNSGPVTLGAMQWDSVPLPPTSGATATFSDLPTSASGYAAIQEAVRFGLFNGFPGGTFQPTGNLTRAQAAKIVSVLVNELTANPPTTLHLEHVAQGVDAALAAAMKSLPAGPVTAAQAEAALQAAGAAQYAAPASFQGPHALVQAIVSVRAQGQDVQYMDVHTDACRPDFLGTTAAQIECVTSWNDYRANGTAFDPQPILQGATIYFVEADGTWKQTNIQFWGTTLPTWAATTK